MSAATGRSQLAGRLTWPQRWPAGWAEVPAAALFKERRDRADESLIQLTPSQAHGVLPQTEYMARTGSRVVLALAENVNMRRVARDDFVIHLRSFQGGIEWSGHAGRVSAAYTVLRPTGSQVPGYYRWLLKSTAYVQLLRVTTNQLRDGQSIRYADFKRVPLPVPPVDEQRAIADYLDRETARIDELIAKQERLIELLRERRRAVLEHAVCRGLDGGVTLARSNDPMLPDYPEHWKRTRLRHCADSLNFRRVPLSAEERGHRQGPYPYYGASGVIDHVDNYLFDEPLVLVSEDGANLLARSTAIAFGASGSYWVNNHAHVLKPRSGVATTFLSERLEAMDVAPVVTGAAQPKLTAEALMSLPLALPPETEQHSIAAAILEVADKIDALIAKAERFIELSKERRAALITAAVTGQIDVKAAA